MISQAILTLADGVRSWMSSEQTLFIQPIGIVVSHPIFASCKILINLTLTMLMFMDYTGRPSPAHQAQLLTAKSTDKLQLFSWFDVEPSKLSGGLCESVQL